MVTQIRKRHLNISVDSNLVILSDGTNGIKTLTAGTTSQYLRGDGSWSTIPEASATVGGIINTTTQTIAGAKTFSSNIVANITGNVSGSSGSCTGNALTSSSCTGNSATSTKLYTSRTINGTAFDGTGNISITEWFHSDRNFVSGTLITTSINYANESGDPWVLEIKGNPYGGGIPFDLQVVGYIYSGSIINITGYSTGFAFSSLSAMNIAGNLCFWFPSYGYWQGFNVKCYTAQAGVGVSVNRITSITDLAKPAGTKEVALSNNIAIGLHSGNYNNYSPTKTGVGASGTWNITSTSTSQIAGVGVNATATAPTVTTRVNVEGYLYATRVYNAVLNDYAECFVNSNMDYSKIKYRIVEINKEGTVQLASNKSKKVVGIVSDNYAMLLGGSEEEITLGNKIPVGLAGQLFIDSKDKVDINNLGEFVVSADDGYAMVDLDPKLGTIVGKIIGIDEENNRYKVVITLV